MIGNGRQVRTPGDPHWTLAERNARIETLRRPSVPAPPSLRVRRIWGVDYDVVWDGSVRDCSATAEPFGVDLPTSHGFPPK